MVRIEVRKADLRWQKVPHTQVWAHVDRIPFTFAWPAIAVPVQAHQWLMHIAD